MPGRRFDASSGRANRWRSERWRELEDKSYRAVERTLEAAAAKWSAWHLSKLPREGGDHADLATMADVEACYRLLLRRPPDAGGLDHYRGRLAGGVRVGDVVGEFLGSVEFARAHARDHRPGRAPSELVTAREGFRIHVDPTDFAVGHTIARTGIYEPEVSTVVRRTLRRGQTFVDIGANIGWFSLLAASVVGPTGRVVAVEPNPWNVALLDHSAKENGFENIEVLAVALAEEAGAVALETDGSNGRVIPIDGPPAQAVEASFVVAAYPLDALLKEAGIEGVDVMKIDVEGAEPLALRGAAEMMERDRPVLITEFYPLALDSSPWGSAEGYLADLRELGYRLSVIGQDGEQNDARIMSLAHRPGHDHVDLLAEPV